MSDTHTNNDACKCLCMPVITICQVALLLCAGLQITAPTWCSELIQMVMIGCDCPGPPQATAPAAPSRLLMLNQLLTAINIWDDQERQEVIMPCALLVQYSQHVALQALMLLQALKLWQLAGRHSTPHSLSVVTEVVYQPRQSSISKHSSYCS